MLLDVELEPQIYALTRVLPDFNVIRHTYYRVVRRNPSHSSLDGALYAHSSVVEALTRIE